MEKRCLTIATSPLLVNACIPPLIITQPQSSQVTEGDSLTLSVVATGTNLTYQWKKDGLVLSGGNDSTYTIPDSSSTDAGSYVVDVVNACGLAISNIAVVVVSGSGACVPPFITSNPSGESVVINDSVTFNVVATGTAPLTYQWQKNGSNVAGATNSSYSIIYAQLSDVGGYHCIVTNACGFAISQTAGLTVHEAGGGGEGGGSFTGTLG